MGLVCCAVLNVLHYPYIKDIILYKIELNKRFKINNTVVIEISRNLPCGIEKEIEKWERPTVAVKLQRRCGILCSAFLRG